MKNTKRVQKAQFEVDDVDVSYYYVGIVVKDGRRVNGEVSVLWRDKIFLVWVSEDSGDWIPDFLNSDDKRTDKKQSEEETGMDNMEDDLVTNQTSPDSVVGDDGEVPEKFMANSNESLNVNEESGIGVNAGLNCDGQFPIFEENSNFQGDSPKTLNGKIDCEGENVICEGDTVFVADDCSVENLTEMKIDGLEQAAPDLVPVEGAAQQDEISARNLVEIEE
ncbi:hypothetical protein L1987_04782 [Smallanthus sonchifolius]|uniref:Uncharacterized protein n=1 Tax=Smallanthus sonchifolius TaxID=185202 RepID=A0ACB9JTI2_9ASTR|nr:hypothetical protein L1987_04782 [Smallanthus sonchifolius]